jgi:hypothetical protein
MLKGKIVKRERKEWKNPRMFKKIAACCRQEFLHKTSTDIRVEATIETMRKYVHSLDILPALTGIAPGDASAYTPSMGIKDGDS